MNLQTILAIFIGGFVLGYFLQSYLVSAYVESLCIGCEQDLIKRFFSDLTKEEYEEVIKKITKRN
jgi:hypothetical protein